MATTEPPEPGPGHFTFELVKLLLQVAWADDDIASEEADALLTYGKKHQLTAEQLTLLTACLAGKTPLPPPNIGYLKEHRLDVMRAVRELLGSDLRIAAEEDAILTQLSALLR